MIILHRISFLHFSFSPADRSSRSNTEEQQSGLIGRLSSFNGCLLRFLCQTHFCTFSAPFKIYNGKTWAFLDLFPGPVVSSKRPAFNVFGKLKKWGSRAGKKSRRAPDLQTRVSQTHLNVAFFCFSLYALPGETSFHENICLYLIKTPDCQVIKRLMRWHLNLYLESQKVNKSSYLCSTK